MKITRSISLGLFSVMDGANVLKHEKGQVVLLETKPTKAGVSRVKRLLKDLNPHIVAVELCLTKLEDLTEMKKLDHQIPLDLIPNRLIAKAKQERAMLEIIRDAMVHGDSCRQRRTARMQMIGLNMVPASLQNLQPNKVLQNRDICKEIRSVFENATWHLDLKSFKYLFSSQADYKIMLAGRPYEDTVCDIIDAMSEEEKKIIDVYIKNFRKLFVSNHSTRSIITHILQRNTKLKNALVDKRDQYLVDSFIEAMNTPANKPGSKRVLAIVRKSRMKGIIKYWNEKVKFEAKKAADR